MSENFDINKELIRLTALEKQLDKVLASETKETLTNWLRSKRIDALKTSILPKNIEVSDLEYYIKQQMVGVDKKLGDKYIDDNIITDDLLKLYVTNEILSVYNNDEYSEYSYTYDNKWCTITIDAHYDPAINAEYADDNIIININWRT